MNSDWAPLAPDSIAATGFTTNPLPAIDFTLSAETGVFILGVVLPFHSHAGSWEYRYGIEPALTGPNGLDNVPTTTHQLSDTVVRVNPGNTVATVYHVQIRQVPATTSTDRFTPSAWSPFPAKTINVLPSLTPTPTKPVSYTHLTLPTIPLV